MKIAFLIHSLGAGGAERAVTGLANFWAEEHEVSIITLVKTVPFYKLNSKVSLLYCIEKPLQTTNIFKSSKNIFLRIVRLKNILKHLKPTIVLGFMMKTNIYAIWTTKLLNIPCIVSERANHNINKLPKTQEIIRNFSYKYTRKLVVQTSGNKRYYESNLHSNKIAVIPNGVSENLQMERKVFEKARENIILNVGAFRKGKAQDVLIRAFAKIPNIDLRLIFVGDGANLAHCRILAKELGIAEKVEFLGAKKNVSDYYKMAQMFVFTSKHEGFPNALLESLYFGVPSISTNCPHGPSDLIEDGINGFLVPVGDVDALALKIEELMRSTELQEKFRNAALESTKKYEIEAIALQWMELVKAVVKKY